MRIVSLLLAALPAQLALAGPVPVVGGQPVEAGTWPDTVNVGASCTGTLIHPQWVVTAAHCLGRYPPQQVMINSTTIDPVYQWWQQGGPDRLEFDQTEVIRVRRAIGHPEYRGFGPDIALLELVEPVKYTQPRVIASDCALEELEVGSPVQVVGWGATRADGGGGTDILLEGETTVQTPDCSVDTVDGIYTGCQPGIEIGAGGNGVDACFGDSGGPLYLKASTGDYLIGATSRAYAGVPGNAPCLYGGIYTRPDSFRDWIEDTIGEALPHASCSAAPDVEAMPVDVRDGTKRRLVMKIEDPDSKVFSYDLVRAPEHGEIEIKPSGKVFYKADVGYVGSDDFVLRVSDDGNPDWPEAAPGYKDVRFDVNVRNTGCSATGTTGSALGAFGLLLLPLLGRRRNS